MECPQKKACIKEEGNKCTTCYVNAKKEQKGYPIDLYPIAWPEDQQADHHKPTSRCDQQCVLTLQNTAKNSCADPVNRDGCYVFNSDPVTSKSPTLDSCAEFCEAINLGRIPEQEDTHLDNWAAKCDFFTYDKNRGCRFFDNTTEAWEEACLGAIGAPRVSPCHIPPIERRHGCEVFQIEHEKCE